MGTITSVSFTLRKTTARSCPLAQRHRYGCIEVRGYGVKAEGFLPLLLPRMVNSKLPPSAEIGHV